MENKRKGLSLSTKKSINGYIFIIPFILGFVFLFLSPLVFYFTLSVSSVFPTNSGIKVSFVGLPNYLKALVEDVNYVKSVISSLVSTLFICPAVLIYSFFVANLLNQKFRGRTLARAISFLPVVIASGIALQMTSDSLVSTSFTVLGSSSGDSENSLSLTKVIIDMFGNLIDLSLFKYIVDIVNQISTIAMYSGVQIIIFLAGLQAIPRELYESSSIEGATAWENFWKITFPIISPIILVNIVYTVVDLLNNVKNPVMTYIYQGAMRQLNYSYAAAMGVMYFLLMFIILGLVIFLVNKMVFYENR